MNDLTPHQPSRPLFWPDVVLDLQELLNDITTPIYVVGGAVRDAYLHRPVKDLDLATGGDSIKLARTIANRLRGDVFVLDAERGVGRVLIDRPEGKFTLDVARFRGEDLLNDLIDRDFTINAMAVDLHADLNALIDPLGGEADAVKKLIRRCSPAAIPGDPIRALRAVRQSVQLAMRLDPETAADIRRFGPQLTGTSPERVRDELFNLLNVARPAAALRVADTLGLLEVVIPERKAHSDTSHAWELALGAVGTLTDVLLAISPARTDGTAATFQLGMLVMQLDRLRARLQSHINTLWPNERPHRALLVLTALLNHLGDAESAVMRADALRLSNAEKQRLLAIMRYLDLPEDDGRRTIYHFWRQRGEAGVDVCLMALANHLAATRGSFHQDNWLALVERVHVLLEAYFERYDQQVAPPPMLDGIQLMERLDLRPGPLIGELLEAIREEQAAGTVQSVEDALRVAQERLSRDR